MSILRTALSIALIADHHKVDVEIRYQVKGGSGEVTVLAAERWLVLEIGLDAFTTAGTREERSLVASADALEAFVAGPPGSRETRTGPTRKVEAVEAAKTTSGNTAKAPSTLLVGTAGRGWASATRTVVTSGIKIPSGCSLLQPQGGREQDGFGKHYVTV